MCVFAISSSAQAMQTLLRILKISSKSGNVVQYYSNLGKMWCTDIGSGDVWGGRTMKINKPSHCLHVPCCPLCSLWPLILLNNDTAVLIYLYSEYWDVTADITVTI